MVFVVPGFDLLPGVRMPDMVEQLARAIAWIYHNAASFSGDPSRILLSGHSSGAHLAAVLATLDWQRYNVPKEVLKALVCVSGAYDLGAVMLSARRSYINLNSDEIDALSPPRHVDRISCPVWVMVGEQESPEFIRQGREFANRLSARGLLRAFLELPTDHFSICSLLADPKNHAHSAIIEALSMSTN